MKKKCTARSRVNLLVPISVAFFAIAPTVHADTITVTNTNDSGPGSLRQALADANDGDTLDFAVIDTIGLTNGELLVDKNVAISGPDAESLAVDGNATSRVFHIGSGNTVSISSLTVKNGGGVWQMITRFDGEQLYSQRQFRGGATAAVFTTTVQQVARR